MKAFSFGDVGVGVGEIVGVGDIVNVGDVVGVADIVGLNVAEASGPGVGVNVGVASKTPWFIP